MSKLGDKERKKLRRTAFELHLQDDQLIGWEDSNFQPNDYQSLALSVQLGARLWGFPG